MSPADLSKALRTAVVGVGYLGSFHAQKHKSLSEGLYQGRVKFVGVYDARNETAKEVAGKLGVHAFGSVQEMIGQVDAVTISSITPAHFELAKQFLSSGVHVNIEKPMTVLVEEAEQLIALAHKNNLVLSVGHSERFSTLFAKLKSVITKPKYVELIRHAPFKTRGSDVSVLLDLAIHDVDLAFALCRDSGRDEAKIENVTGAKMASQTLDWANFDMRFKSGVTAHVSVSRVATEVQRLIRVYEDKVCWTANFQTLQLVASMEGVLESPISVEKCDNLLNETEAFFAAILDNKPIAVTGLDGLKALQAVAEAQRLL
jgi:predicted dehydrogenase